MPEDKAQRPQQTTTLRESWQPAANATGADPARPPKNNPVPKAPAATPPGKASGT
jgi:hypothetical protein